MRALPLRTLDDVNIIKREVKSGNILILRVSPIAKKNVKDIKRAVNELCRFTESVGGDIARLGEERVVITPSFVRIWREKSAVSGEETATAA
ncbi:MAG: cell division protein SepF [Candidatus Bathyarchaeota archaeon]|nr:MAG: cell division protein SepF [Candidatus Bathyarchaeota archaeon]